MIEYDGSKCTPHGQTRCALCQSRAGKQTAQVQPPASITGGPPSDIEGFSVRARLPQTTEEANTDYDKILAEVNNLKMDAQVPMTQLQPNARISPGQIVDFLPIDDSHASKVLRAAAWFAGAVKGWAQELAHVENIKKTLMAAEAELSKMTFEKDQAEFELKRLVTEEGGAA